MDDYVLSSPGGEYRALALRAYDAKSREWSIRWLDGRYPSGPLGTPVKGRFEKGVGSFYDDFVSDGKPMRVRFIWSDITPTSARWQQAVSADRGQTWDTNWIMNFQRTSLGALGSTARADRTVTATANATALRDFDFLLGEWRVHHRYLRVSQNGREWAEGSGTCSHRNAMGGWANIDEFKINAPGASYRAVALRSFDAKAGQWAIWWLDGRNPSGDLDPPMKGRFENGVGTFYGDVTIDDKPTRVRFTWSRITHESARWEQAYSRDEGETWETNWTMEFTRTA
jgi:hypothetical protein